MYASKERVFKLLDWLFEEVINVGGDGDGVWLSVLHPIEELSPVVKEWASLKCPHWNLGVSEKSICLTYGQEWLQITTDKEELDAVSPWIARIIW